MIGSAPCGSVPVTSTTFSLGSQRRSTTSSGAPPAAEVTAATFTVTYPVGGSSVTPTGSPTRGPGPTVTVTTLSATVSALTYGHSQYGPSSHIQPAPHSTSSNHASSARTSPATARAPPAASVSASAARWAGRRSGSRRPIRTRSPRSVSVSTGPVATRVVRNLWSGPSQWRALAAVNSLRFDAGV